MSKKSLTLGEIDAVERESGQPFSALGNENKPQGRLLAAYAMVIKKRSDPKFNMAKALELNTDDLTEILAPFQEEDSPLAPAENA